MNSKESAIMDMLKDALGSDEAKKFLSPDLHIVTENKSTPKKSVSNKTKKKKQEKELRKQQKLNAFTDDKNTFKKYLMRGFVGKPGWKFVSISGVQSMFTNEKYEKIVLIQIHKTMPTKTDNNRYTADVNDIVKPVKLRDTYKDFQGLVMNSSGQAILGVEIPNKTMFDSDSITSSQDAFLILNSSPQSIIEEVHPDELSAATLEYMDSIKEQINLTNKKLENMDEYFKNEVEEDIDDDVPKIIDESKLDGLKESPENIKALMDMTEGLMEMVDAQKESIKEMNEVSKLLDDIEENK